MEPIGTYRKKCLTCLDEVPYTFLMDAPATADPADLLPRATYHQVVHTLRGLLPPPVTGAPEAEAYRDLDAIAHVASLLPANPDEAHLAAQALDCLRLARAYSNDPSLILTCTARSASMMREARGWRTALERAQSARRKREADPATRDAATATEQRALGLLAEALDRAPPAEPATPDPIAEAERYALQHRKRAVLIRRLGRLPDKIDIGVLTPEVVHAIVTGTTPRLRALDDKPHAAAAVAA
jgi:hypothetical protein